LKTDCFFQVAQLPLGPANLQFTIVPVPGHGDACGVVAAIFELLEPINNDGHHTLFAYVTDYSAHGLLDSVALLRDSRILLPSFPNPDPERSEWGGIPIIFGNLQEAIQAL